MGRYDGCDSTKIGLEPMNRKSVVLQRFEMLEEWFKANDNAWATKLEMAPVVGSLDKLSPVISLYGVNLRRYKPKSNGAAYGGMLPHYYSLANLPAKPTDTLPLVASTDRKGSETSVRDGDTRRTPAKPQRRADVKTTSSQETNGFCASPHRVDHWALTHTPHVHQMPAAIADQVASMVAVHLAAGNRELAHATIDRYWDEHINQHLKPLTAQEIYDQPIGELGIPLRELNCLESIGIVFCHQLLVENGDSLIRKIANFGPASANVVLTAIMRWKSMWEAAKEREAS